MKRVLILLLFLFGCYETNNAAVKEVIERNSWLRNLEYVEGIEKAYDSDLKKAVIVIYVKQKNKLKAAFPVEVEGFVVKISYLN